MSDLAPVFSLPVAREERRLAAIRADLAQRIQAARYDFSTWVELAARDEMGQRCKQGWIHRTWMGHAQWCWAHGLQPVFLCPRGLGKTVQLAVEYPVWWLGRHPTGLCQVVCNTDTSAKERVAAAERIIRLRRETQWVFPHLQFPPGPHSSYSFDVVNPAGSRKDKSLSAFGVLSGSGLGTRANLQIHDDVVDESNSITHPALRGQLIARMENTWRNCVIPPCTACEATGVTGGWDALRQRQHEPCGRCGGTGGGKSLGIGTAWHEQDYWHTRMTTPGYCTLVQRVNETKTGYTTEVYGVPVYLKYPSLDDLICLGNPSANRDELLTRLHADMPRGNP